MCGEEIHEKEKRRKEKREIEGGMERRRVEGREERKDGLNLSIPCARRSNHKTMLNR